MARARIVSIAGSTATGTTTLNKHLSKVLNCEAIYSEDYLNESPYFTRFLEQPKRWAFHNQAFFMAEYLSKYQEITRSSTQEDRILCFDYMIFELPIYTMAMKEIGYLTPDEFDVLDRLFALVAPILIIPDVVVYISADIDSIMDRIRKRGREGEINMDREYISTLQACFDRFVRGWTKSPLIAMDSTSSDFSDINTVEDIARKILNTLRSV